MARWDEILTLPVQNPPTLEFSSAEIVWSKVEGWRDMIDRVALIPFSRVNDFVRGESANKECPTKFHVEARRRRPPEMPYKPKVDGILEYILYWCSFGPDDHRKGGVVRPSRTYTAQRKTSAGRPNTKRGCTCHFIVKRLIAEPTVALIIYNQTKHVDKQGLPCHGPQDSKAVGTKAMYAPYISDELRLRILSLLHVGVPVETIMQRHNEMVEKQGGPCNRDDLLTHRYVRRQERNIRRSTYELDEDDAVSVGMWIETHRNQIFFYEDFSDIEPFVLGIQTEWQLQLMIRFGNRSLVASHSRFGTNKLKYPVHSLLVFDSDNKAIPVAWIITPQFASTDMHRWLRALYDRVRTKDPTWQLGGFIVDDPSADVLTIREVFQCSVLICFWHVRHAWHKNLIKKCSETATCVEMSKQLGRAIYSICRENGDVNLFEDFMEDFVDCSDFLDYFKATWVPRMGLWATMLKALPFASQETCSAMECYHQQLKLRLLNEEDSSVYQRADWLVSKLGTKVHSYYWLDEYAGKDNFARYWKDEWKSSITSWRQAFKIPDVDVILESRCAKVISQKNREKVHIVWNPGTDFAICGCDWSRMGNICKHVIKVTRVCRDRGLFPSSISLFEYNRILTSTLHCPPHDSLTRDHAVVLAISVQKQLSMLFNPDNGQVASSVPTQELPINESVSAPDVGNGDEQMVVENQPVTENAFSNSDVVEGRDEVQGELISGVGCDVLDDQSMQSNRVCDDAAGENINGDVVEIDACSAEASATELASSSGICKNDGILFTMENKDGKSDGMANDGSRDAMLGNAINDDGVHYDDREISIQTADQQSTQTISLNERDGAPDKAEECDAPISNVLPGLEVASDIAGGCHINSMDIDTVEAEKDACDHTSKPVSNILIVCGSNIDKNVIENGSVRCDEAQKISAVSTVNRWGCNIAEDGATVDGEKEITNEMGTNITELSATNNGKRKIASELKMSVADNVDCNKRLKGDKSIGDIETDTGAHASAAEETHTNALLPSSDVAQKACMDHVDGSGKANNNVPKEGTSTSCPGTVEGTNRHCETSHSNAMDMEGCADGVEAVDIDPLDNVGNDASDLALDVAHLENGDSGGVQETKNKVVWKLTRCSALQ